MTIREIFIEAEAAISSRSAQEACLSLAKNYYWKFISIHFTFKGLVVISEDQAGYPFEALNIEIAAEPKVIQKACLALLRELD